MRILLFLLLALSAQAAGRPSSAEALKGRPNLIVIQTDEHNFRTLGCYRELLAPEQALMWGKNVVETPHIDSLCERGVICTSFMGVETAGKEEGRDASQLLLTGEAPQGWKDVAFMRSTNNGWICAMSDQHKLVFDPYGRPWLFDLNRDPDEMINFFTDKNYREVVRGLSKDLRAYGEKFKDPVIGFKPVKADMDWAIAGEGKYEISDRMGKKKPGRIQRKKKGK